MRFITKAKYALMIVAVTASMGATKDCGGKAAGASYAGDGVTMFVGADNRACSGNTKWCSEEGNGKLRFGKTYTAEAVGSLKEFPDCEWSVYTINASGRVRVQGKGTGRKAKIKVDRPETVHVFLKSEDCGLWK
jgi:hypothetical protein